MATAKAKAPSERVQLLGLNASQNESGLWTYVPPTVEQIKSGYAKWRPIWCAGYNVVDPVCGKLVDSVTGYGIPGDFVRRKIPSFTGKRLSFCGAECCDEFRKNWQQYIPDDAALARLVEPHYHHIECLPCHCQPGPQIQALQSSAREIALWGGRNSAKSEATFPFLIGGNKIFDPQNMRPADSTYLNCADYTGLVIRKNAKDLRNYFERAVRFFKLFGGEPTYEPMGIKWPKIGSYLVFDHMADGNAWEKYQGPEWTRMVIEEAPQLGDESNYLKLIASCRTSNPDMTAQIMLTGNPGGAGWRWFKARFLEPDGKRLKSNQVYTDKYSGRTRVHIFSSVDDNPLALAKGGDKDLDLYKSSDASLYKQWRYGDPDAVAGAFFETFRPQWLESSGEPSNACHTVKPHALDKYWPRAIACDWGYSHPSSVGWGCWHPKKQLHVYREMLVSRMGTQELGAEIAKRSLADLHQMPSPHMALYLSHDAFARENDRATEAELMKQGIERILGPDAAFLLAPNEEEELLDNEAAWSLVRRRQQERARKTHITIVNAGKKRRGNMNTIRDYLRWWPIQDEASEFSEVVARRILENEGVLAYHEYKRKCEKRSSEVLPVLQIHFDPEKDEGCPRLVAAIQAAVESETDHEQMEKQDGDDPVDMLAYLAGNFAFTTGDIPRDVVISERLAAMRDATPGISTNSLVMAARQQEAEWDRSHKGAHAAMLPRRAARRQMARVN